MRILIIGAGLGGLSAAIAFSRQGHHVTLFESRSTLSRAGGGINIRPGATRIMNTWGLEKDLEKIGDPTGSFLLRNAVSGDIAVKSVLVDTSDVIDWGTTREALMKVLYERAKEAGAEILFGMNVDNVEDDGNKAVLTLKNGSKYEADLILAADGIRSSVRYKILSDLGCLLDPILGDTTLYGVTIPSNGIVDRPDMTRICEPNFACVWMGHGNFVVSRRNTKLNQLGALFGIRSHTDQKGLWDENGDIEFVRSVFKDSAEDLRAVLKLATSCDRWKLAEVPDLPRWTSKHGRIVLLGDSAHGMEPNAAQGFSMIIEDIGVLEYLLSRSRDNAPADVPNITRQWQLIQKPRVDRIKAYAKENGKVFLGSPPSSRVRTDAGEGTFRSAKHIKADANARMDSAAFVKWTLDYDAVAETREFVEGARAQL